jgi:hypothetical protein
MKDTKAVVRTVCSIVSVILQSIGLWFIITHTAK